MAIRNAQTWGTGRAHDASLSPGGGGTRPSRGRNSATSATRRGRRLSQSTPAAQARLIRLRRADEGKCTRCGRLMPEDDFRARCPRCRRDGLTMDLYRVHYLKDFR